MNNFVKVGLLSDLPEGSRLFHDFEYDSVIIINCNGQIYCIADLCSHDEGELGDGPIVQDCQIECPRHGARFSLLDGSVTQLPAVSSIPTYQVKLIGDEIWIEQPED